MNLPVLGVILYHMEKIKIYYADNDIAVCEKPRGVISQESPKPNMPRLLKEQLGVETIYTVHRLDENTTGVMVYALNQKAAAVLSAQIQTGGFKKQYRAVLQGRLPEKAGRLQDLLFYDRQKSKSYIVKRQRKGVKNASLNYEVTAVSNGLTYVNIDLETGRTHQIRAQFANLKAPVLGDGRYGSSEKTYIHLHCRKIEFTKPGGEKAVFESPVPWEKEF